MPIYEYKCEKCGNLDEHLMRFSDVDPEGCTKCGAPVHKIVSQSSFSLKGSGWYVTDYKKQSGAPVPDAPPPVAAAPDAATHASDAKTVAPPAVATVPAVKKEPSTN